jgi:hypothetical protein
MKSFRVSGFQGFEISGYKPGEIEYKTIERLWLSGNSTFKLFV